MRIFPTTSSVGNVMRILHENIEVSELFLLSYPPRGVKKRTINKHDLRMTSGKMVNMDP